MEVIMGGKGSPPPQKKKTNRFVRLMAFLATAALILGAVALVAYRDKLNIDALKRWYTYRNLERSESGQAEFYVDGGFSGLYANLDGDLICCSAGSGVRLYSDSGVLYATRAVNLEEPMLDVSGKYAAVYDAGGRELFLYAQREEVFSLSLPAGQPLISAGVNQHGWLAVVTQESGYKGAVTVYNGSHQAVMKVRLSSRFVLDAAVSPDARSLAVLTVGLSGGSFDCQVDFYRLDRVDRGGEDNQPDWSCSLENNTVLDLRWDGSGIWALGESALCVVSPDGTLAGSYSYDGSYLKAFSLEGEDSAALLLGRYRAGSSAQLLTVGPDGEVRGSLEFQEQVLSISAAGRYVAVLTAGRVDIYDRTLESYASLENVHAARRVIMRTDGTALLLGAGTVWLFIP